MIVISGDGGRREDELLGNMVRVSRELGFVLFADDTNIFAEGSNPAEHTVPLVAKDQDQYDPQLSSKLWNTPGQEVGYLGVEVDDGVLGDPYPGKPFSKGYVGFKGA